MKQTLLAIGLVIGLLIGWSDLMACGGDDAVHPETIEITAMGIK